MIYLVRHGESVVNVERRLTCKKLDGDLTDAGRRQARLAGNWLAHKQIDQLYTSPFHRAIQTASIIGELLNCKAQISDAIGEIDCGELEGQSDHQAWYQWRVSYRRWLERDWTARFPGGESFQEGYDRLSRFIYSLDQKQNIVLVTHGGISRTVVPHMCLNVAGLQEVSELQNTGMVLIEPDTNGRFICESWNLLEHIR